MTNQADYSKPNKNNAGYYADREAAVLKKQDINFGGVVVLYKGNDTWVGLRGRPIFGAVAANDYAKRLNELMNRLRAAT